MKKIYSSGKKDLGVLSFILIGLLSTQFLSAQADWYDADWLYRSSVAVSNPGATDLADFQVQINLSSPGFDLTKTLSDGNDVRVTAADGTTLIPFWIESWTHPASASIWVKVPSIPVAGTTVYIYYGNPSPPDPSSQIVETPPIGPFTRAAGNPITPAGATGMSLLAENIVYDPVTQHYWMCMANYSQGAISLCWSDTPTNPASWTWSSNVITNFTEFHSGAPHLMLHGGVWYLFYADRPNIEVATATNAAGPYTIQPTPVLTPSGVWDDFRVDEPFVFQRNDGKWILIYMADAGDVTEQVGYATADNITGPYTPYTGNPCIPFGPAGSYDAGTVADPWVYEYHGTYYIGYTVSSTKGSPWQTALATTTDWVTFTKHGVILPAAGTELDAANSFRGALTRIGDEYVFSYTNDSYRMAIATQPVFQTPPDIVNNPDAVFDFYDGFDGTSLDLAKWSIVSGQATQATVTGGLLTLNSISASGYIRINGTETFGRNYIAETRGQHPDHGTQDMIAEVGLATDLSHAVRIADDFKVIGGVPSTMYWQKQAINGGSDIFENMAQRSDNNWHIFRVFRQGTSTAGFQVDDNPSEGTTLPVPTINLSPFLMSYGNNNDFVVDWTRVRKWAGADPVITISPEDFNGISWTGAVDTDWHKAGNWWENAVPDANTNVIIDNVENQPLIAAPALCNSVIIISGATIGISGTNTLTVSGNWTNNGGSVINGTGTYIFNGSAPLIGGTASTVFDNLTINSSATTTLGINTSLTGNLSVNTGVFDLGNFTCNRSATGGTLYIAAGAGLKIGTGDASPMFASFGTHDFSVTSTVEYYGGNQSVPEPIGTATYGNLILSGTGTKTLDAGLTNISNNLTFSGTGTAATVTNLTIGGNVTLGAGTAFTAYLSSSQTVAGNWINNGGTFTPGSGTVTFNGSVQTIGGTSSTTFNNLVINSTTSTTLGINTIISGDLNITKGVYDLGTFTSNRTAAGGTLTLANASTLKIGGTNTIPSNFTNHSIGATSVINYYGENQDVAALNTGQTYGHLTLSGSGIKTFSAARTVRETLTITGTAQASLATGTSSSAKFLILGGTAVTPTPTLPSWGSTLSPATTKNDVYFTNFTNAGIITVTAAIPQGTWLGGVDSNWRNSSNWSGGLQPGSGEDMVLIPNYAINMPIISGPSTTNLEILSINHGATVTIAPSGRVTITTLLNDGTLNLESDENSIASLRLEDYLSTSTGVNNIQLLLTGGGNSNNYSWHYISSPVSGLPVSTFTGTTWDLSQYIENYPTQEPQSFQRGWVAYDGWSYLTGTYITGYPVFNTFNLGRGYNYWHSANRTYVISGNINTQNPSPSPTIAYSGTGVNDPYAGYNLLGNPFTCSLNMSSLFSLQWPTNLLKAVWFTKDNVSYVFANEVGVPSTTNGSIPPMQGFFVKATGLVTESINFRAGKTHSTTNRYKGDAPQEISLVRLSIEAESKTEETVVRLDTLAKSGLDIDFDAPRFLASPNTPSIYSVVSGAEYTINGIPFPETTVDIPIVVKLLKDGKATISAMEILELNGYNVTLTDKSNNSVINLKSAGEYEFSGAAGIIKDRFILSITNISTGIDPLSDPENIFKIYNGFGMINIQPLADAWDGKKGSVRIMDLSGKTITLQQNAEFRKNTLIQLTSPATSGLYFIEIRSDLMKFTGKVVVK